MSILYLIIKLYPLFGLSGAVLCVDLARNSRRKASNLWIGFVIFAVIFAVTVGLWIFYRGDLHSEQWFADFARQFR